MTGLVRVVTMAGVLLAAGSAAGLAQSAGKPVSVAGVTSSYGDAGSGTFAHKCKHHKRRPDCGGAYPSRLPSLQS
jgi:hypothetical protein